MDVIAGVRRRWEVPTKAFLNKHETLALKVLAGIDVVLLAFALVAVSKAAPKDCETLTKFAPTDTRPFTLVGIALSGMLAGYIIGYVRRWMHNDPDPVGKGVRTDPWLLSLLVGLLTVAMLALAYETFALGHEQNYPPITEYIRCAAAYNMWLTGIISFFFFFLLGSWLWYPGLKHPKAGKPDPGLNVNFGSRE